MINNILIVCTGNTCRSPMAERLLKRMLKEKNYQNVQVHSAGILPLNNAPASQNAILVMAEYGIDMTDHVSQPVTEKIVQEADLILVMEEFHRNYLSEKFPEASHKIKLVKEYLVNHTDSLDIIDPIGKDITAFRQCAKEIRECLLKFVEQTFPNEQNE